MSASNSPKAGTASDPFLPGVREGFKKRFPNDDVVISDEPDFGIDPNEVVLLDQLARGAYGVVYKGVIKGKTHAIKVQEQIPALEEQVNILVELALLKSLKHERLVASSGSSRIIEKRSPYEVKIMIAMELCDNGALRECLARNLSWDLRVRIARDVIEGINYMHEYKIVHRDIKTTNILISGDWRAKVCDFSFACHVDNLSKHDYVYGTDEFMAPEIALGEDFGTAADIFSYGIVLAEMISGQEPSATFLRRSARDLFALDEDELRGAVLPECPESLEALTLMCCEKEGEFRITAPEVLDWLQSLLEDRGVNNETIEVPEKEANDFSNVVSPIREGTVVYPKTDEAHLIRYKSAAMDADGVDGNLKRAAGRSKSMNSTPNRDGAVEPTESLTPMEREKLQFGDISAPVSHSGFMNYTGKVSQNDSKGGEYQSKPEIAPLVIAPVPSLSSMVSRVAYLELQIQELKAENKSLNRGVSALVMMSEDMKRAARENFGDLDGGLKKRTPRSGSPRSTPTGGNAARRLITHRKSRSEDASLHSSLSPGRSPTVREDIDDETATTDEQLLHKTPHPPPPPPAGANEDLSSVTVSISGDLQAEDSEQKSFAQLRANLQNFVGSGQFAKSVSSIYVDPNAEKTDGSDQTLTSSPSFDAKKGPAGAMKLFGIGSFEKKLRKVGTPTSPLASPTEQNTSPYDRSRLKPVPPPPPKSNSSLATPHVPPPPPQRESVSESALFSEAQLAVVHALIKDAIETERVAAEKKHRAELNARFSEEKKHLMEYIDSKFSEVQNSVSASNSGAAVGDTYSPTMSRNMSVSFGGMYREMYDDKDNEDIVDNFQDSSPDAMGSSATQEIEHPAEEQLTEEVERTEPATASQTLSSPQLRQLTKLENQMEVILAALGKLTLPISAENPKGSEQPPASASDQENVEPEMYEDDEADEGGNEEDHLQQYQQYRRHPDYHNDPRFVHVAQETSHTSFGSRTPSSGSVRKSPSSGSYDNYYDDQFSRVSPAPRKSPLARDINVVKGGPNVDLTNAFRSFVNEINHADEPVRMQVSRSEYEAGIRPGYYDLSGRPVSSPQTKPGVSPKGSGSRLKPPDSQFSHLAGHSATPSSRRGISVSTPLSASSTWREVDTPSTSNSRPKVSPASGSRLNQGGRSRASSKSSNVGGPGGNKYNQIGTRGTPQMLEADSTIASNFFRMHNSGTSLGREEAAYQRTSPKSSGWIGEQEVRTRGPGSGSRGSGGGSAKHSPVSLRQILQDGNS